MNTYLTTSYIAPRPREANLRVEQIHMRGKSTFPFGPVGIRQDDRRKPYRANEMPMASTPRRRLSDFIDEDERPLLKTL